MVSLEPIDNPSSIDLVVPEGFLPITYMEQKHPKSEASLHRCVRSGNIEHVKKLINNGAAIDDVDEQGFTPLHWAANVGAVEVGAEPTMVTNRRWTAIHITAIRGFENCLNSLIARNIPLSTKDSRGYTPGHLASIHGNSHCLEALLKAGADLLAVDIRNWTMLHAAAFHGRLSCFQMLLRWGLRFEDGDKDGNTPGYHTILTCYSVHQISFEMQCAYPSNLPGRAAHLASMEGHLPILQCLISHCPIPVCLMDMPNDHGETVDGLARRYFKHDVVAYLENLRRGQHKLLPGDEELRMTAFPAHTAAYQGNLAEVRQLVELGTVKINDLDEQGSTLLHKASGQGHVEVVQWLLENGGKPETPNYLGETAIDVSRRFGQLGVLKLLTSGWRVRQQKNESGASDRDFPAHTPVGYVEGETQEAIAVDMTAARARAREKMRKYQKLLAVARCDYKQLGGETSDDESTKMEKMILEAESKVEEMTVLLDYERMRREKLEARLHLSQQEINQLYAKLNCQPVPLPLDEECALHHKKIKTRGGKARGRSSKTRGDDSCYTRREVSAK